MANSKKPKNIYEDKEGVFHVRVRHNGKTIHRRAHSKREANRILKDIREEIELEKNREPFKGIDIPFTEYVAQVYLPYKIDLKPQSMQRLKNTLNKHILPYHRYSTLSQVTSQEITERLSQLYSKGYSKSSIKKVYDTYHSIFNLACNVRYDLNPRENPMNTVKMIPDHKFTKAEIKWFKPKEVVTLTKECRKKYGTQEYVYRYGLVYLFVLNTGLRQGEVCALNKEDVDIENATLTVNKSSSISNGELIISTPKTRRSNRIVPLNGEAVDLAKEIFKQFPDTQYFFYNANLKPVRPYSLSKEFTTILKNCGLEKRGMHALRHTFVTYMFESGSTIQVIASIIGDNVATVEQTYLHLFSKRKAQDVQKVNISQMAKQLTSTD